MNAQPMSILSIYVIIPVLESILETINRLEQTSDKVTFLVGKFDSLMQRDWDYYYSKNSGKRHGIGLVDLYWTDMMI